MNLTARIISIGAMLCIPVGTLPIQAMTPDQIVLGSELLRAGFNPHQAAYLLACAEGKEDLALLGDCVNDLLLVEAEKGHRLGELRNTTTDAPPKSN